MEIRFESELPEDAIFGVIYNKFKDDYSSFEKLPILQIPEALRSQDSNLMYQPHYKLQDRNFLLQIGPKVFSFVNIKEYVGWKIFSQKIYTTFSMLADLGIIASVTRFGLRYINLFENINIYEKSTVTVALNETKFEQHNMNMTIEIPVNGYVHQLRMLNHTQVRIVNKEYRGSIIDIDTVQTHFSGNFFDQVQNITENAHTHEKILFFSVLQDNFIQSLNPVY